MLETLTTLTNPDFVMTSSGRDSNLTPDSPLRGSQVSQGRVRMNDSSHNRTLESRLVRHLGRHLGVVSWTS